MTNKKLPRKNQLDLAIEQIEHYITDLHPRSYNDIKTATHDISKAAIGAYLSVHTVAETLDFINQLAHTMTEDVFSKIITPITIPEEYLRTLH